MFKFATSFWLVNNESTINLKIEDLKTVWEKTFYINVLAWSEQNINFCLQFKSVPYSCLFVHFGLAVSSPSPSPSWHVAFPAPRCALAHQPTHWPLALAL